MRRSPVVQGGPGRCARAGWRLWPQLEPFEQGREFGGPSHG